MPKKILYESAIHQLLWAGKRLRLRLAVSAPDQAETLSRWLAGLNFEPPGPGAVRVSWPGATSGFHTLALQPAKFYTRGDAPLHSQRQTEAGLTFANDRVLDTNLAYFDGELRAMLAAAAVFDSASLAAMFAAPDTPQVEGHDRKLAEEMFQNQKSITYTFGSDILKKAGGSKTA